MEGLASNAKMELDSNREYSTSELITQSEKIITKLSRQGTGELIAAIEKCLNYKNNKAPKSTRQNSELAEIWWPLILSTNYDRMLVDKYKEVHRNIDGDPISIYGRSSVDCHSLLTKLRSSSNTAYWALQGYLGMSENKLDLKNELIVGYRQYRAITYNNLIFRAAFSEVFRNYSFLFIGSGLSEDYFRGLFGEVLEKLGENPYPHFALVNKADVDNNVIDPHFLHTKLNLKTIIYEDNKETYDGLPIALKKFKEAISGTTNKMCHVGYGRRNFSSLSAQDAGSSIEIIIGGLPQPKQHECTIISAGYDNLSKRILLSGYGKSIFQEEVKQYKPKRVGDTRVWQYGSTGVFAAVARNLYSSSESPHDARDLREVSNAVYDVLNEAAKSKYSIVNSMLLAAGKRRIFPPIFSLIQMIRGFKEFDLKSKSSLVFRIYVVDPAVIAFIRQHPLEIEELLLCNDLRVFVEIHDNDIREKYQLFLNHEICIKDIADAYSLNSDWGVEISPNAFIQQHLNADSTMSINQVGLIPGSTIIFYKK